MVTKKRQNGDRMETKKKRQIGDSMETDWRQNEDKNSIKNISLNLY